MCDVGLKKSASELFFYDLGLRKKVLRLFFCDLGLKKQKKGVKKREKKVLRKCFCDLGPKKGSSEKSFEDMSPPRKNSW